MNGASMPRSSHMARKVAATTASQNCHGRRIAIIGAFLAVGGARAGAAGPSELVQPADFHALGPKFEAELLLRQLIAQGAVGADGLDLDHSLAWLQADH